MANAQDIKSLVESLPALDTDPEGEKPKEAHMRQQGKLTGPTWEQGEKTFRQILDGGKPAVLAVIDLIDLPDTGPRYKARYALYGAATLITRIGSTPGRQAFTQAVAERLAGDSPTALKALLIGALQICGDNLANAALAPLLAHEELCDPASRAMASIGGDAADHLRKALAEARGRRLLSVIDALGSLRDAASADALIQLASSGEADSRAAALWALSRIALPQTVEKVIAASSGLGDGGRRQGLTTLFALAENLAARASKAEAARVYQHLQAICTDKTEKHLQDAAAEALSALK